MFEDEDQQQNPAQNTLPQPNPEAPKAEQTKPNGQIEDIFADTDTAIPAPSQAGASQQREVAYKAPSRIAWVRIIVILVILCAVGAGAYYGYTNFFVQQTSNTQQHQMPVNQDLQQQNVQKTQQQENTQPVSQVDTDFDGLTDVEERSLGTSLIDSDSDHDGLNDYEEVKVWKTNPLNPDSDGDTFTDGEEVKGGYDPNGPGKITDVNNA